MNMSKLRQDMHMTTLIQVIAAIRMAMYHIGQLQRREEDTQSSRVELYWLDAVRDVPALCEVLLNYLKKLQASPGLLLQV
jgi:predicted dienelactone hydrolase